MIRVVVYSEVRLYEEALARVLDAQPDIQVVGTTDAESDLGESLRQLRPEVLVADLAAPDSYLIVEDLLRACSDVRVVAVCVPKTEHHVVECFRMGITNVVVQSESLEELIGAVRAVARGEILLRPHVAAALGRILADVSTGRDYGARGVSLTSRERQVVELIDQGLSNKEIAGRLGIKLSTVKNHVHSILEKLQVRRRGQAAALIHGRATRVRPQPESRRARG